MYIQDVDEVNIVRQSVCPQVYFLTNILLDQKMLNVHVSFEHMYQPCEVDLSPINHSLRQCPGLLIIIVIVNCTIFI